MEEFRAEAARRQGRPSNWLGAFAVVATWIAAALLLLWLFWPDVAEPGTPGG